MLIYYQMHGWLRRDVLILNDSPASSILGAQAPQPVVGNIYRADWIIFEYRQTQYGQAGLAYTPLQVVKSQPPVYEVNYQGVPLMDLFARIR